MLAVRLVLQIVSTVSAQGVVAATHVDPIPGGVSRTEVRVVEPTAMLFSRLPKARMSLHATLSLEGLTMPGGQLTLGAWGEGFVDRRHPHTYVHELMVSATDMLGALDGPAGVSLSAGKGFVPYGSDDPMSRPVLAYPVNHHWSQLLERAVAILGLRAGPVLVEGALYNGDEPEKPGGWPRVSQFGNSWSTRVTLMPRPWLELEGSRAAVNSPEHRPGAGTVQQMWHVSARAEGALGAGQGYALAEWARVTEASGFFAFTTALAEASWTSGGARGYYRFERTDRPEESRTLDLFRTQRPHVENSILGTTRWTIHTAGSKLRLGFVPLPVRIETIVEGSYAQVASLHQGLFDPVATYGRDTLWSLTVALRISVGADHRMGRYGAAMAEGPTHLHSH